MLKPNNLKFYAKLSLMESETFSKYFPFSLESHITKAWDFYSNKLKSPKFILRTNGRSIRFGFSNVDPQIQLRFYAILQL